MFKTILVPASGSDTDAAVFATALALARPFGSHLQFLHVRLDPRTALLTVPQFDFCMGTAVSDELTRLRKVAEELSANARKHVEDFCKSGGIAFRETPFPADVVTARWVEAMDLPGDRLMAHARHSDLVVLGRRGNRDHLPAGLIEEVLGGSGRPIVIAHASPPRRFETVAVGWKEAPEAARALAAALPLLKRAASVILLGIPEDGAPSRDDFEDLARQLLWHGINARIRIAGETSLPAGAQLLQAAVDAQADLLVIGGFGHARLREFVLGGVTQTAIDHARLPVFLMH